MKKKKMEENKKRGQEISQKKGNQLAWNEIFKWKRSNQEDEEGSKETIDRYRDRYIAGYIDTYR